MKLARTTGGAFTLTVSAIELSSLIAAARLAADVLDRDEHAPPEAGAQLRALIADFESVSSGPGSRPDGHP